MEWVVWVVWVEWECNSSPKTNLEEIEKPSKRKFRGFFFYNPIILRLEYYLDTMLNYLDSSYKKNIDGLRAIAVISVIIFHLDPILLSGGFIGVDIFFVISGYLISKIITVKIDNKNFKISEFFMARARRILPMLFFILLFFFPLIFFLLPSKMISISQSILSSLFFVSNIFFYLESGYFGEAINLKPYIHLWSLSVEEQFYIIFPLYCILFYKKKYFLYSLFFIFFISFFLATGFNQNYPNANFFLSPTRIWEILFGIFFMFLEKRKLNINLYIIEIISFISLFIILLSFIFLDNLDNIPNIKLFPALLSTGVLILFGNKTKFIKAILCNKHLTFIGLISYSLYMLHQPILAFNKNLVLLEENLIFKILFLILLILISSFSWKYIEQPFRNSKKISNKLFLIIISTILVVIIAINLTVIKTSGFISNYKEEVRPMALLNPLTQGRYVSTKFNLLKDNKLDKKNKQNILIMGDSHAQDFINMAYENDYLKGYTVKTKDFHIECYSKFINKKNEKINSKVKSCKSKIPESLNYANTIVFINVWEDWLIDYFNEIINNEIFNNKKIYIIGVKTFGKIDIKKLINLSDKERLDYKFKLDDKWIKIDEKFKSILPSETYVSPYNAYCNQNLDCRIFTNNNELISYDGGHLTKMGAKYLGKKLFEIKNLKILKNYY